MNTTKGLHHTIKTLGQITIPQWHAFIAGEPEYLSPPKDWSAGLHLTFMTAAGLNAFQMKGTAEVGYWPPLYATICEAVPPKSPTDLLEILLPFYERERIPVVKVKRLNTFLNSHLAQTIADCNRSYWSIRNMADDLKEMHLALASIMGQSRNAKTIVFAIKCLVVGMSVLEVDAPDYEIAVPVDIRVRGLTGIAALLTHATDGEIRDFWSAVRAELQWRNMHVHPSMFEIDSFLWQIAQPDRQFSWDVANWLVESYGFDPDIATSLGLWACRY